MTLPTKKNIALIALGALIIIQFIQIDKSQPNIDPSQDYLANNTPSAEIGQMIRGACYDCHSHETVWPWYTNVQPLGWWIKGHVNEGKEHLNFSTWGSYDESKQAHKLEECVENVEKKWMPLTSYGWLHPEGRLSDADRAKLAQWFRQ